MNKRSILAVLELQLLMANPVKRMLVKNHIRFLRTHIRLQEQGQESRSLSDCLNERLNILYGSEKITHFEAAWIQQTIELLESVENEKQKQENAPCGQGSGS